MATEFLAHYGKYLGFALFASVLWAVMRRFWKAATPNVHQVAVHCLKCGWRGNVSRYKPRCSKCGASVEP